MTDQNEITRMQSKLDELKYQEFNFWKTHEKNTDTQMEYLYLIDNIVDAQNYLQEIKKNGNN